MHLQTYSCVFLLSFLASPLWAQPLSLETTGLDKAELKALSLLLSQGACPCDKHKSILECVPDDACPAAKRLAEFGARKFKEGLSADEVQQAVVKKYIQDHVHYEFDLSKSPSKGDASARVTLVEFADFQCAHCAKLSKVMQQLTTEMGASVYVVFKQFPMTRHPFAHYAARASLAAHRQGQFWGFHDLLFRHQFELSQTMVDEFAKKLGLDMKRYTADRESPETYAQIERDRKEAIAAGLRATPTLYIDGKLYSESKSIEALRAHLKDVLNVEIESKEQRKTPQ
jgi:protein-disulfide isomerase